MNSNVLRQPTAHLVSLATAVPDFGLAQDDVARRAGELFAPMVADFSRLTPIYRNAEIEQRHSCVPIDWYSEPHSFGDRNDLLRCNTQRATPNFLRQLAQQGRRRYQHGGL